MTIPVAMGQAKSYKPALRMEVVSSFLYSVPLGTGPTGPCLVRIMRLSRLHFPVGDHANIVSVCNQMNKIAR